MPFPNIDPIAFAIGPIAIRWYALSYLAGIFIGVGYGMLLVKRTSLWMNNNPPMTANELFDFAFWIVIGIVVGGRLGYVVFYDPAFFAANPLSILALQDGGMSFHGGMLGVMIAMIVYLRHKGANVLSGLDLLACCSTIGLLLGRVANFINGELYGSVTTMPWGVVFPGGGDLPRHPSQLYEGLLEGLVLFLVIRYFTHIKLVLRSPGTAAGIFGIGYAASRIFVEFFRLPDAHIGYLAFGWLTMGMVLSLPILIAGIALIVWAQTRRHA
ncbi:prolipoprotein diacylglyceryl transferase [Pelagibacterium lentulum]|uniref:Phosphatidylglycerol--prolipoprotein diacylglyceryl transferase n=1 Tax=Pelagibacterium lentulum TaxID=2029865 RepID=A0A916VW62_9HYPH|nr:prolipoprotein diacylglyceryl transferase [Pelagibacterium lentulum]GGA45178.1 prolipoprotein diacylglyceryl transferase [Pelagibacterium lentulum]